MRPMRLQLWEPLRSLFPEPGLGGRGSRRSPFLPAWAALGQCGQRSPGDTWGPCLDMGSASGSPRAPSTHASQKHSPVPAFRALSVPEQHQSPALGPCKRELHFGEGAEDAQILQLPIQTVPQGQQCVVVTWGPDSAEEGLCGALRGKGKGASSSRQAVWLGQRNTRWISASISASCPVQLLCVLGLETQCL